MTKIIQDEVYRAALSDKENVEVMDKAAARYIQSIPFDDLYSCKLLGLWEALRRYDSSRGRCFKYYLHYMVKYQCLAYLRDKAGKKIEVYKKTEEDQIPNVEMMDSLMTLPIDIRTILYQRYYMSMNLVEIAKKHDCSIETVRRRIKEGIELLQSIYLS